MKPRAGPSSSGDGPFIRDGTGALHPGGGATYVSFEAMVSAPLESLPPRHDVGHRMESVGVRRIAAFLSEHESFASLEEAAAAIARYLPGRAVSTGRLTRNLRQRADGRWVWKHGLGRRIREREGIVDADE